MCPLTPSSEKSRPQVNNTNKCFLFRISASWKRQVGDGEISTKKAKCSENSAEAFGRWRRTSQVRHFEEHGRTRA